MKRFLALLLSALLILSTLTITVSASNVINYNFDNAAEDGVLTQAEMTTKYGATFATGSAYTFEQSGGMLIANTVGMGEDSFTLPLDQVFTEGKLEFKSRFKIDSVAASGGYNIFTILAADESNDKVELLRANSGTSFARPQGNSDDHGWVGPALVTDSEGFLNVSIVITNTIPDTIADKTGKNFYVTVNDMNAGGAQKSKHTIKVLDGIASLTFGTTKNLASRPNDNKVTFDTLSFKKFVPEVISVSAPAGSISPKVGKISLGFNIEVDASTIADGITFEKADGGAVADLAISPTADKKGVDITFGTLDITDYVLSVNSNLKADDADKTAFASFTRSYTAVVEPFELISVSNEGGTVMPSIGKIEIAFNNPIVDEANLLSSISFTKANGKPIPGGATVRFGETNDKVEVLVGRVGKGEYVLTIASTLKDAYGDTLDEPVTYGYIVEEDNPAMVDISFDTEDRAYTYTEVEEMEEGRFSASSLFEVTGVDGGLEFREPVGATGSVYKIYNAEVFSTGKISYNFVLKNVNLATAGDNQFRISAFTSADKSVAVSNNILNTGLARPTGLDGWYSGNEAALTANEDGYFDFTIEFTDDIPTSRKTANSTFIMYVYDNVKGSTDPALTVMYSTNNLTDIAGISLSTYKNTAGKEYERAAVVKSIKAMLDLDTIPNHVMSSNAEAVNPSEADLSFIFTNAFKNITADGISFMADGNVVEATAVVNADEKSIKIVPVDFLSYGQTYSVAFPAPLQAYEFTTEGYPERLSATTNGLLLDVSVVNNEHDDYVIVATFMDAEGNKISANSAVTSATSATIAIPADADSVVVNAYKVVDGCYIKASLPVERSL